MHKKYYFISGLPRSGSTLLSSILNQNPRFTSGISDPLLSFANGIIRDSQQSVGTKTLVDDDMIRRLIRCVFDTYYSTSNQVCFNTNRGWCEQTDLLKDVFPEFKMIVCLRDVPWILDSFEQLHSKNLYTIKPLYHHQQLTSVYDRTNMLMGNIPNFSGYVSGPLNSMHQSMFSDQKNSICYVDYDDLVKYPMQVIKSIYKFIGEPWFDHDFNSVEARYDEYDNDTKIKDLHTVRRKVEYIPRKSILPNDLWERYASASFWKMHNFDHLNWIRPHNSKRQL